MAIYRALHYGKPGPMRLAAVSRKFCLMEA
jgi:hypothetical protein